MTIKRTAVITGSTSGIGLNIATALAGLGHNIVLNSFSDNKDDHAIAADLAARTGAEVIYIQGDMSKADQARGLVTQAAEKFGSVDILVNNAGIQHVEKIEDFPIEKWDAIIAINLSSAFHTSAAAVPLMKEKGWGRIINIASAHGLHASPFKSAYVAAKHGMVGLTKTVALEFAAARVAATCNVICPGYVWTPMVSGQIEDQMKVHKKERDDVIENVILERQPSKEFVTVEQLAQTVLFLCSPAADQITGAPIPVDGGWGAL